MKKILVGILILTVLLSLCACQSKGLAGKQPVEMVDVDTLLYDLSNQAKATLNIGKATTMFVTVEKIYADYCEVRHVLGEEISFVYMPVEELAQLQTGQYTAIYGVIESVESNSIVGSSDFQYVFKNASLADMAQFDAYMADHSYNKGVLLDYLDVRGSSFALTGQEIPEFLVGTWENEVVQYVSGNGLPYNAQYSQEITFSADGTCQLLRLADDTWQSEFMLGKGEFEKINGKWTVSGDYIEIDFYQTYLPLPIYKITENKFVFDDRVFIRCS